MPPVWCDGYLRRVTAVESLGVLDADVRPRRRQLVAGFRAASAASNLSGLVRSSSESIVPSSLSRLSDRAPSPHNPLGVQSCTLLTAAPDGLHVPRRLITPSSGSIDETHSRPRHRRSSCWIGVLNSGIASRSRAPLSLALLMCLRPSHREVCDRFGFCPPISETQPRRQAPSSTTADGIRPRRARPRLPSRSSTTRSTAEASAPRQTARYSQNRRGSSPSSSRRVGVVK